MLSESVKELLRSDAVAHVTTLDRDGSPYVTLAWVGADAEELVFATLFDQRKLKNLRRDPRVALSFHTNRSNESGLLEYLVVYGRARITEGGAAELLQELARTYIDRDAKFPPMPDPPPGYVTHVAVERIGGVGPWTS